MACKDLDHLAPCPKCGSLRYWFNGTEWVCAGCDPSSTRHNIAVTLSRLDVDWAKLDPLDTAERA